MEYAKIFSFLYLHIGLIPQFSIRRSRVMFLILETSAKKLYRIVLPPFSISSDRGAASRGQKIYNCILVSRVMADKITSVEVFQLLHSCPRILGSLIFLSSWFQRRSRGESPQTAQAHICRDTEFLTLQPH